MRKYSLAITLTVLCACVAVVVYTLWWSSESQPVRPVEVLSHANASLCTIDSSCVSDAQTDSIIKIYRDSINSKMSEVLCYAACGLECRRPDSEMMRFIADALLCETRFFCMSNSLPMPDVALFNVGGIRDVIHKGPVSVMNLFQISPFENIAVVVEVDSAGFMEIMDHVASRGGEALAGMTMSLRSHKAADVLVAGNPLVSGRSYYVATLDYLADGGDSFECMPKFKRFDTCILFRDMLSSYMRKLNAMGVKIQPSDDKRITVY